MAFSSAGYEMTIGQVMGRTILEMDPPEHLRHRALVARAFRARVLDQWSDAIIGATISELIDALAGDGHADLIPQLTFPFPVRVIARILGLPEADWPRFLQLSTELIAVMRNWDRAVAAGQELRGYFAEIIADRRRHTRDDLVSQLIEADVDGRRLGDDEIYPFLLLFLPAGAETTYRSSSNLPFGLLSQPGQLDAVSVPSADGRWSFRVDERSAQLLREVLATTGALVCGRRLFDHTSGWDDSHPVGAPVVVVTHHPPRDADTWKTITFAGSVETGIAAARRIAGDKDVSIASASIAAQALDLGLVDEVLISLVPVLMGKGIPYFANLARAPHRFDDPVIIPGGRVTHLRYAVRRTGA